MSSAFEVETDDAMSTGERLVTSGATMMRVEADAMLAVSLQRPRDEVNPSAGRKRDDEAHVLRGKLLRDDPGGGERCH